MPTTETSTPTAWKITGRNALGRIVASETAEAISLAHRIANTWRGHGMAVSITPLYSPAKELVANSAGQAYK